MNPREAEERLGAYVAGRLGPADTAAFETVMERDPALRRTVANHRFLRDRLSRLRDRVNPDPALLAAAPAPAPSKKKKKKKEKDRPAPTGAGERPLPFTLLAIGLVIVVAGVGGMVFFLGDGAPEPAEAPATGTTKQVPAGRDEQPEAREVVRKPTTDPAKPSEPKTPVRPTAVKPGVEMLIPRLLLDPSQARLEGIWAALAERPERASAIYSRIPMVKKEDQKVTLILALATANREPEVRHRLLTLLESDGSASIRRAAAAALGHVPGKGHPRVEAARRLSVRAGLIEDAELRQQLLAAAATERDPAVVGTLIRLLGPSRSRDATIDDLLFELAHSPDASLRAAAIDGLRAGADGNVAMLERLIEDDKIPVGDRARLVPTYVEGANGEVSLERLFRLIDGGADKEIRAAAVRVLTVVGTQAAVSKAILVLRNTSLDRVIRLAAAGVLAASPLKDAVRALEGVAGSEADEAVRGAVEELLRARGLKSAEDDGKKR